MGLTFDGDVTGGSLVEAKANTTEKNLTTPARRQGQKTPCKPVKTLKIKSNNDLKSN